MTNRIRISGCHPVLLSLLAAFFASSCGGTKEAQDPAALIPGWRTYYNREVGIELQYPYTLQLSIEDAEPGQVSLDLQWVGRETSRFMLETYDPTMEFVVRQGERSGSQTSVMVGGMPASRFETDTGITAGLRVSVQRTILINRGRLYVFTGDGEVFDEILESVKFLDQLPGQPES